MSREDLCEALFELVDVWTQDAEKAKYIVLYLFYQLYLILQVDQSEDRKQ
jgi:hypothetical protein